MDLLDNIFKYDNKAIVCGLTDELFIIYYYNYFKNNNDNVLIVTNSLYDANTIYKRLRTYTDNVYLFPMDNFLSSVAIASSPDLKVKRLEVLKKLKENKKIIVVTNLTGYLKFLPSIEETNNIDLTIKLNSAITRDEILEKLNILGYKRDTIVTATGEFAVRGFIIDIFPIESDRPIRIEFFGDEIDSIRYFDEDSQLSLTSIDYIKILPFNEIETTLYNSLFDYMNDPFVFFVNPSNIKTDYNKMLDEIKEYIQIKNLDINSKFMYDFNEIIVNNFINIETLNNLNNSIAYKSKETPNFKGNYDNLKDFVNLNYKNNKLIICLSNEKQIELISKLFNDISINNVLDNKVNIINKKINKGFVFNNYVFISEYDIEEETNVVSYKNSFKMGSKIKDFNELNIGDYVVHNTHGIGIYGGLTCISRGNLKRDYLLINYANNDKVYIPVEKIDTIFKYNYGDGVTPKVNALNSINWVKTKMRVKNKIKDISEELIKLYAERASKKGFKFNSFEEEDIFGSKFEFDPTSDQIKCFSEIDKDLIKDNPMDRLLCGDVGFGKTEVAFRAMFKTVMNGYQVAYLCPTTLLSRQQYFSAINRFKDYPINIKLLNRFISVKESNQIINDVKDGKIDILIGTHKLLNKNIIYKNLGLLVIDEEQRFGVTQKEKIKSFRSDVNVLTLSATPIPRTLKMAMSGLRDLSIIDTAPINRYPVQTYVLEENDLIIKDAIYKELSRDGQVFILYNYVEKLDSELVHIKSLIPEAKIAIAHGKMEKNDLEKVVSDYIEGKYDILLCTTIIETGIDIPNVNTLIVIDADRFGLSQLYQLRGRVGRSDKIAYAYLMYKPGKILSDVATKRLKSIEDFTELGSGYKIALRDLSIRGAGDILGSEQAGFIDSVGLDLYTQMVNDEIKKIKGEEVIDDENIDNNPLIQVSNHIDDNYVSDETIKIEIHKLINEIDSKEKLDSIKQQIEDRFGKINEEMLIYMYEEWFEKLAYKLNIKNVLDNDQFIEIQFDENISNKIDGEKLFLIVYNININFKLSYRSKRIIIRLQKNNLKEHFIFYEIRLLEEILNMININKK